MGPAVVVVLSPSLDCPTGVRQVDEPVFVEAFVPELSIEAFHIGVLNRLARFDTTELNARSLRPSEHGFAGRFGAVIDDDFLRRTMPDHRGTGPAAPRR